MPNRYAQGFSSQRREVQLADLPIEGHIPAWLCGTLIRNGPGQFEVGQTAIPHWFDGLAMLHAFSFDGGRVGYANRFLRSNSFYTDNHTGKLNYRGFAQDPCRNFFQKAMALFFGDEPGHNAVVNITRLADRFIAMTESPMTLEFDPITLATLGVLDYDDDANEQIATAHPHNDPQRGFAINQMMQIGMRHSYRYYAITASTRRFIGEIPTAQPAYVHSFAITPNYIVLAEFSLRLTRLTDLAFGQAPFITNFDYLAGQDSRFVVLAIDTGKIVADVPADPFFAFHHINAFEQDGAVVLDISAYDNADLVEQLYTEALKRPHAQVDSGEFRRYTIPLHDPSARATYEVIGDQPIELPRINYHHNGHAYRYAYGASVIPGSGEFLNQLVKVDTEAKTTLTWRADGCFPSEPVFVAAPDAEAEDAGVLLSVVLDSQRATSFLLVLDAATMQEMGRALVPQHVPFGFHGQFFGGLV